MLFIYYDDRTFEMENAVFFKEMLSVYSVQNRADNGGYGDMEAITASVFEMEDDILATVQTDYYRPENTHSHDDDRLRVVGTEGILEVIRGGGEHEVRLINKDFNGVVPQQQPPFIFEDFVNTLEGGGEGLLDVDESFRNAYVRNAFLMSLRYFPRTVLVLLTSFGPMVAAVACYQSAHLPLYLCLIFGAALSARANAFFLYPVFQKHLPTGTEASK